MDVYQIWARSDDYYWLVGAWDDDTISENRQGYEEELAAAHRSHGYDNVRVVRTTVDFDAVVRAFEPPFASSVTP